MEIRESIAGAKRFVLGVIRSFRESALDELRDTGESIRDKMREPGKPVTYPIDWDSERQRRFVMAKLRRENNLPYRRTGGYINSWTLTQLPEGVRVSASHPAGAIGGTLRVSPSNALAGASAQSWQSRIHRGRWRALLPTVLQAVANLSRRVIDRVRLRSE